MMLPRRNIKFLITICAVALKGKLFAVMLLKLLNNYLTIIQRYSARLSRIIIYCFIIQYIDDKAQYSMFIGEKTKLRISRDIR